MSLHRILPAVLCCGLALSATEVRAQPRLTEAEATQLFGAAGYRVAGGQPVNRCGAPANPRVSFVDINGDQRPEALFVDESPCYAPTGRYFAVLTKQGTSWRAVISGTGTVKAQTSSTSSWLDLRVAEPGCTRDFRFQGNRYAPASDCAGRPAVVAAPAPASPAAPARAPAAQPQAAASAAPAKLSPADEAAAFKAAGFTRRGNAWRSTDCGDPGTASSTPGTIEQVVDLNGDGRPEVLITEGGAFCYGNTGGGYFVVTQRADGGWKRITNGTGMAEFLKTKGTDGWPDLLVGGPGFCFPVQRWNGREYNLQRWEYQGKACKPPR
jgi:hypothetical protein